jgi:serine/threonine-protein kinase
MLTLLKNRYRILRSLNSGGFGETFLAEDTDMPSARRCVIKKLIPIASDPQIYQLVKERFGREAVILEKLGEGNSHIPSLYAYFEETGQFYLVQEWIEGTTLAEKVERDGVLVESSVREILINILSVLDSVHAQHIVHRDIKPENIIIRSSDNQPVLIDFGAVKETMGTLITTSGRNSNSIVIGTPGFMPSEQSIGRPVYASDLYSLGLTAIYLLTNKYPQEFATHPATGEILWREDALGISQEFAAILDKAIQSHPRDRYSSAKEMLDALQKVTPIGTNFLHPSPKTSLQKTAVFSPKPTEVEKPVTTSQITSPGLPDWIKTLITGSIVGCFMMGALVLNNHLNRSSNSQSTAVEPTRSPIDKITTLPTIQPTIQPTPELVVQATPQTNYQSQSNYQSSPQSYTPPSESISQQDAVDLIKRWQSAKNEVFAPPYNRDLASEMLTDKAYHDNISRSDGQESSIDWLQNNNSYYTFGVQKIDSVESFVASENAATIDVVITEQRTLYNRKGRIDPNASGFDKRIVRYNLRLDNGQWKISEYKTVKRIWKK